MVDELVLSNPWLERRFAARIGEPFRTIAFVNQRTGRDYARPSSREFSFAVNGRALTTDDFVLREYNLAKVSNLRKVVVALHSPSLAVELYFEIYDDHPVIRKWMVLRNQGAETLTVTDLDWESLNLIVDTRAAAEVWTDYFSRRGKSAIVTMDDCVFLVNDPAQAEGFILASEAPGPLKRLEAYAQGDQIAAGYNRDDETIFERVLAPGEEFRTAASFILPFANAVPQDVVDDAYARFVADHLTVCDPARVPTIVVNSWVPFLTGVDRATLLEQIDRAAELGVDAYQVDDGWYDRLGDWNDDRSKFPNGLDEVAAYARARGVRFGLWMAIATVDEQSQVYREHREWLSLDANGNPNRHPVKGTAIMCLDSGYFDFILAKMNALISRCGVDLLKLDFSVVRNVYAPGRYHGCYAANHAHRSPNDSHLRLVERLFDLVRSLKREHPRLLVDVTYEAYGVMDGTDLGLTQVADQDWFTNLSSQNETNLRREIYQRGRVVAPWTLNTGGAILDEPGAQDYGFFSVLAAHGSFWGDLAALDDQTREHYRRWFAWVKAERARGDFYRWYRVSNVFPVPDGVSARDYRHAIPAARYGILPVGIHPPAFTPESAHPGEYWDGVARLDPRGQGPIFLFRPAGCTMSLFQLRIPWLARDARYLVRDPAKSCDLGTFPGDLLIEQGIEIQIPEPARAKVLVLRRE